MKTTKTILTLALSALLVPLAGAQEVIREKPAPDAFPAGEVAAVEAQPVEVAGTLAQVGDASIAIRTQTALEPVQYRFTNTTQWVDQLGNVVTRQSVQAGLPVTVWYSRVPEGLVVSKVVVRRQAAVAPVPQAAPSGVGERTETTVERREPSPARVTEREVVRERPAPKVIERKPVVVERPAPTVVERPAPPMVERNTTTTTTTTEKKKSDDDDDDD